MKGFVITPAHVVDLMVDKLFRGRPPFEGAQLLDPGCGTGEFIEGVLRWCIIHGTPVPAITGVESDPQHVATATDRFARVRHVRIVQADFLCSESPRSDYVIGNPPYVPITGLSTAERDQYRRSFSTARGRFDLYLLFFEQALRLLKPNGRLVFITPEKYVYVSTASPLRQLIHAYHVEELHFLREDTFPDLVTYPLVSTVVRDAGAARTRVILRTGRSRTVRQPSQAGSWMPLIRGVSARSSAVTLSDVCTRISCGVATGADSVFVVPNSQMPKNLARFARPTIAGRQLSPSRELCLTHSMLLPYTRDGTLLPEQSLGQLGEYLAEPARRAKLLARTCVAYKPWYAFHETPPMRDLLRPKILCKDIGVAPHFSIDREGAIVPRHSVYYIVPASPHRVRELAAYLNSSPVRQWLRNHCQRAAKGFIRLQSHVLKRLPVPERFVDLCRPDASAEAGQLTA